LPLPIKEIRIKKKYYTLIGDRKNVKESGLPSNFIKVGFYEITCLLRSIPLTSSRVPPRKSINSHNSIFRFSH